MSPMTSHQIMFLLIPLCPRPLPPSPFKPLYSRTDDDSGISWNIYVPPNLVFHIFIIFRFFFGKPLQGRIRYSCRIIMNKKTLLDNADA